MIRRTIFGAMTLFVLIAAAGGALKGRLTPYFTAPPPGVAVCEVLENRGIRNIVFDIQYPKISGFSERTFEEKLNRLIALQAEAAAAGALEQAKQNEKWVFVLRVSDEVKNRRGILSLRVTDDLDNGGTGFPNTVYYNADISENRMLTLDDLFDSAEYRKAINGFIQSKTEQDEHFFPGAFKGVAGGTSFFIAHGQLCIAFAKYEIASGMTGEPVFEIPTLLIRKWLKAKYALLFW